MADDLRQVIKEKAEETMRHFDVVADDLKGQMQQIAEGVTANTQRLDRLDNRVEKLDKDLTKVKDDVAVIKSILQEVNLLELKQEIMDLQKRVAQLEAKEG